MHKKNSYKSFYMKTRHLFLAYSERIYILLATMLQNILFAIDNGNLKMGSLCVKI